MKMKTEHPTLIRARKFAESIGSTAKTAKGIITYLKSKNRKLVSAKPKIAIGEMHWLAHRQMDVAAVGAVILTPVEPVPGYLRMALADDAAERTAREVAQRNHPRKKKLYSGIPKCGGKAFQEREEHVFYKNYPKGSEVFADYQSCVAITQSGRSAVIVISGRLKRRRVAPKGLSFGMDANGVLLRRSTDAMDYHPTGEDWRARNFAARVRSGMAANLVLRRAQNQAEKNAAKDKQEAARVEKIKAREIANTRVTLRDSRQAGNCIEGSLVFAEKKLGLTRAEILAGDYLFSVSAARLMRSNDAAAKRAIEVAWKRETTISI